MHRRRLLQLGAIAALSPMCSVSKAEPQGLRAVPSPCSLQKIAEELSRRYEARVFVDPLLADLRVMWEFRADASLDVTLARLAELTDSRVSAQASVTGKPRFTLERPARTTQLEASWWTEGMMRPFRELLRAYRDYQRGKLDPATFTPNLRVYFEHVHTAPHLKGLTRLTGEQIYRLFQGEELRFPPGAVPEAEIREILEGSYWDSKMPREWIQQQVDRMLELARRYGTGLRINFSRQDGYAHLEVIHGPDAGLVLCRFGYEEMGLPLTRTNPYRLLEAGGNAVPAPRLPAVFDQPLTAPLVVTRGGMWSEVIEEVARATGMGVMSDGYWSRHLSRQRFPVGQKQVLAPAGSTVAEALDQVCGKYGYLWWQRDGCLYLRASAWPWDILYEVPDRFLEAWNQALDRSGTVGVAEVAALAALTLFQRNGLAELDNERQRMICPPDQRPAREMLEFFALRTPAQQAFLLGPGLVVDRKQASGLSHVLFPFSGKELPERPFRLRLGQSVEVHPRARPPLRKVILKLVAPGEELVRQPVTVAIPRRPDPFAP